MAAYTILCWYLFGEGVGLVFTIACYLYKPFMKCRRTIEASDLLVDEDSGELSEETLAMYGGNPVYWEFDKRGYNYCLCGCVETGYCIMFGMSKRTRQWQLGASIAHWQVQEQLYRLNRVDMNNTKTLVVHPVLGFAFIKIQKGKA